jgi:hypothetical protein
MSEHNVERKGESFQGHDLQNGMVVDLAVAGIPPVGCTATSFSDDRDDLP